MPELRYHKTHLKAPVTEMNISNDLITAVTPHALQGFTYYR